MSIAPSTLILQIETFGIGADQFEIYKWAAVALVLIVLFIIAWMLIRSTSKKGSKSLDAQGLGFADLDAMRSKGLISENEYRAMRKKAAERQVQRLNEEGQAKTTKDLLASVALNPELARALLPPQVAQKTEAASQESFPSKQSSEPPTESGAQVPLEKPAEQLTSGSDSQAVRILHQYEVEPPAPKRRRGSLKKWIWFGIATAILGALCFAFLLYADAVGVESEPVIFAFAIAEILVVVALLIMWKPKIDTVPDDAVPAASLRYPSAQTPDVREPQPAPTAPSPPAITKPKKDTKEFDLLLAKGLISKEEYDRLVSLLDKA